MKVGVIGISEVGKTQFLNSLSRHPRQRMYVPDLFNVEVREFNYDNRLIEFYDFHRILEMTQHLDVILLMIDDRRLSYRRGMEAVRKLWKPQIRVIVVQNKIDLIAEEDRIPNTIGLSVKNGTGITDVLEAIVGRNKNK